MSDKFKINPFTGELDNVGDLGLSGGILTGDLEFPVTGYIMNDGTNRWRVTINSSGAIVTTLIVDDAGTPMGLLLSLTYAA